MKRLTPASRLSLALAALSLCILLLAEALGLAPGSEKKELQLRQIFANQVAKQLLNAITRANQAALGTAIENALSQNPSLISIGIYNLQGYTLAQSIKHPECWKPPHNSESSLNFIRYPLLFNQQKKAEIQLCFTPFQKEAHPLFNIPSFFVLLGFVSLLSGLGFWFYLRRSLKYLDPTAVVPARVRNALNILTEGIIILDKREHILLINQALCHRLQQTEKQLLGQKASQLGLQIAPNQPPCQLPWVTSLSHNTPVTGIYLTHSLPQQKTHTFKVNAVPIFNEKNIPQGTIAVFDDVTELQEKTLQLESMIHQLAKSQIAIEEKNRELTFLATRDPLTNCYNRRALYEFLDGKKPGALTSGTDYACIMGDIDHFKKVNDTHGHNIGDDVIKTMAEILNELTRNQDIVARMGGEEFCIILPRTPIAIALDIADRCRQKIGSTPIGPVRVTASFGVSGTENGAKNYNEIIHQADLALYHSKENGRNKATAFSHTLNTSLIAPKK